MKKILLLILLVFSAAICISQPADAVTLSFEEYPDDTQITDQYAYLGVIFDSVYTYTENDYWSRGSGYNWIAGEVDGGEYNDINPGPISGYFVNPLNPTEMATTDYVSGLNTYSDGLYPLHLEVFDINGTLIGSDSRYDDGWMSVSVAGIHSFVFSHEGFDDVNGWDDITFNDVSPVQPIPEPATMLLFGSGLIGLAGVGRKKFKN